MNEGGRANIKDKEVRRNVLDIPRLEFNDVLKIGNRNMIIQDHNTNTEYSGYFTKNKVERKSIPEGWYLYEMRSDRFGNIERIENKDVYLGFAGSFVTDKKISRFMFTKSSFFEWLDYGYSYFKVPEFGFSTNDRVWGLRVVSN